MIKNERQYRITRAAAENFAESLRQLESGAVPPIPGVDPAIQRAEREALESQLDDLRAEIREYEDLVSGRVKVLELTSLAELPRALVRARIASGLSQKQLAERLGIKEQQVQRYEATDYQQASLSRLLEIAGALKISVRKDLVLPTPNRSAGSLFSRLREIGLTREFVLNRLVPRDLALGIESGTTDATDRFLSAATGSVAHIFGWTPAAILSEGHPWLDNGVLGAARFKGRAATEQKSFEVYTFYAHFLALLLLKATEDLPLREIPTHPTQVHQEITATYGTMSFRSALLYCWDLGVPVLPLSDAGAFHGACWRVDRRNIIVLKQRTRSLARWLFDLLHELRHASEDPQSPTHAVIELPEEAPERFNAKEEVEASRYAGEVALDGMAEQLAKRCVQLSGGRIERLKSVVPVVAREAGADVASLANYMAFRLSLQKENWWGAATNLQPHDEAPWDIARDVLIRRANLSRLNRMDRELFIQALQLSEI